MGRDLDSFEWVNAWAEATGKLAAAALPEPVPAEAAAERARDLAPAVIMEPAADVAMQAPARIAPEQRIIARIAATMPPDQLMRDIAEIERARDALASLPLSGSLIRRRTQAFTLVAARTSDPVPVVVGGVFALVMLTVFGAAAAMTRLAR